MQSDLATRKKRHQHFKSASDFLLNHAIQNVTTGFAAMGAGELGTPIFTYDVDTASVRMLPDGSIIFNFNPDFYDWITGGFDGISPDHNLAFVTLHEELHVVLRHMAPHRWKAAHPDCWCQAIDAVVNEIIFYQFKEFLLHKQQVTNLITLDKILPQYGHPYNSFHLPEEKRRERISFTADHLYKLCVELKLERERGLRKPSSMGMTLDQMTMLPPEIEHLVEDLVKDLDKRGSLPGTGTDRRDAGDLEALCGRQVAWTKEMSDFFMSRFTRKLSNTWTRPPRKLWGSYPEIMLPSPIEADRKEYLAKIYLDISDSRSEEQIRENVYILQDLARQDAIFEFYLFNEAVHDVKKEDLLAGKFKIGGGTSFHAIDKHVNESKIKPDVVGVVTDGCARIPEPKNPENWLWVIDGASWQGFIGKFGKVVAI